MSIAEEKDWLEDLEAAWESAEKEAPDQGDTVITKFPSGAWSVESWDGLSANPDPGKVRILKRAPEPEPKPQAVMANSIYELSLEREVYVLHPHGCWRSELHELVADELVDPAPLVELPDIDAVREALEQPFMNEGREWPGSIPLARAVLELLEGKS